MPITEHEEIMNKEIEKLEDDFEKQIHAETIKKQLDLQKQEFNDKQTQEKLDEKDSIIDQYKKN